MFLWRNKKKYQYLPVEAKKKKKKKNVVSVTAMEKWIVQMIGYIVLWDSQKYHVLYCHIINAVLLVQLINKNRL